MYYACWFNYKYCMISILLSSLTYELLRSLFLNFQRHRRVVYFLDLVSDFIEFTSQNFVWLTLYTCMLIMSASICQAFTGIKHYSKWFTYFNLLRITKTLGNITICNLQITIYNLQLSDIIREDYTTSKLQSRESELVNLKIITRDIHLLS